LSFKGAIFAAQTPSFGLNFAEPKAKREPARTVGPYLNDSITLRWRQPVDSRAGRPPLWGAFVTFMQHAPEKDDFGRISGICWFVG
jgi:hypothetical protein